MHRAPVQYRLTCPNCIMLLGQGSVDISTDLIRVDVTVSQNLVCDDQFAANCNAGQLQNDVNKKLNKVRSGTGVARMI